MSRWHMSNVLEGGSRRWLHTWSSLMGGGKLYYCFLRMCVSKHIPKFQSGLLLNFHPSTWLETRPISSRWWFRSHKVNSQVTNTTNVFSGPWSAISHLCVLLFGKYLPHWAQLVLNLWCLCRVLRFINLKWTMDYYYVLFLGGASSRYCHITYRHWIMAIGESAWDW